MVFHKRLGTAVLVVVLTASAWRVASAQARRAAPAPKPTVPQEVDTLKTEVKSLRTRVEALEADVAKLMQGAAGGQRLGGNPPNAGNDRVAQGLRKGTLAIGMSIDEVVGLIGHKGDLIEQTAAGDFYRFQVSNRVQVLPGERAPEEFGAHLIYVTFRDGKAVAFRRQELPQIPARPRD
jgi:hypothetical protein